MTFDEVIDHFGDNTQAAIALDIRPQSVSWWKRRGVPAARQKQIETVTGGRLKVDPHLSDDDIAKSLAWTRELHKHSPRHKTQQITRALCGERAYEISRKARPILAK